MQEQLAEFPRVRLGHLPTRIERLPRLGAELGLELFVKRDDCTGAGFGGNKVRQLEFYLGAAKAEGATVVLITGAVQSNFVRTAAAMAAAQGMACHIQLEERVAHSGETYRRNGNVLLDQILGATLHAYAEGEDEAGADAALEAIAGDLRSKGEVPYVVHLGAAHPPLGALGYAAAAVELIDQVAKGPAYDAIFLGSGSGLTHAGLLLGLRELGDPTPVVGICVRRAAELQIPRLTTRLNDLARLLGVDNPVDTADVMVDDQSLSPGYGQMSSLVVEAIRRTARLEGLFLDPVYTGKVMAGLIALAPQMKSQRVLFWHTGGLPALFAYADELGQVV